MPQVSENLDKRRYTEATEFCEQQGRLGKVRSKPHQSQACHTAGSGQTILENPSDSENQPNTMELLVGLIL